MTATVAADLAQYPTTTLLQAIAERLAMIELRTLERDCLLERPQADISLYGKLQELLAAGRAWDADAEDASTVRLENAIDALSDVSPGDIVALGQRHALLHRRYVELQYLYRTRMKVTQDYAAKLRAKYEQGAASTP